MVIRVKSTLRWAAAVGMTTLLSSCTATTESTISTEAAISTQDDKLQVVTTFLPMTAFTEAVVGVGEVPADELRAEVIQLLPASVDPHDYQAKPQDVQRLAQADVLIKNGLSFELFLSDLIANVSGDDLIVVDASEGIDPILVADYADDKAHEDEGHQHDDHGHGDHGHGDHDHDHESGDHDSHDHGPEDPHVWLDPKKAIQQVENIRDALVAADPEGKSVYEANAADYIEQLQALDRKMTEMLAPYEGKTFVTHHDFADYFARSYGLNVEYLVDAPEQSAAPGDVLNVIEVVKASNLKTLLSEPGGQEGSFEAIAQEAGVSVSVFDPLETSGETNGMEVSASDYYLTVMNQNLENLMAAFSQVTP